MEREGNKKKMEHALKLLSPISKRGKQPRANLSDIQNYMGNMVVFSHRPYLSTFAPPSPKKKKKKVDLRLETRKRCRIESFCTDRCD